MTAYIIPLLTVIALCAFWAIFQIWLEKRDPQLASRSAKCGNCNCDRNQEKAGTSE